MKVYVVTKHRYTRGLFDDFEWTGVTDCVFLDRKDAVAYAKEKNENKSCAFFRKVQGKEVRYL